MAAMTGELKNTGPEKVKRIIVIRATVRIMGKSSFVACLEI
jgi:hypothetical protein